MSTMKRLIAYTLLSLAIISTCMGQKDDSIVNRIVLIGDAGAFINGRHPVSVGVKKTVPFDKRTLILYLGDNLYKEGLPDDAYVGYAEARSVLDSQLSIVENTQARLIMIPGNHDWNNGGEHGYQAIIREQNYVNILGKDNVQYFPQGGCPGPVEVPLGKDVVLVLFDSQWFLHPYDKPGVESDCPYKTETEMLTQLTDIITRNLTKLVILACHHPFRSTGIHGGYFGLKQHIFPFTDKWKNLYIPLPGLGSIYPISRSVFGSPQDLPHPIYQNMIREVEAVVKAHPNVIFVAGHEHNLQLIKDSSYNYIISGSGSKTQRVAKSRKTKYVAMEHGFTTLEVSKNKNVDVTFYITQGDSIHKDYSSHLLNFEKIPDKLEDTSKKVTVTPSTVTAVVKDTINVAAGERYGRASGIQRWALGDNYREEWSTKVNMKVFHLNNTKGGFKITGLGGGKQTKSLKLEDKSGKEWTLRTIDKDPELAIPQNFRNSIAENIVQDLISAAHPYAPLAIPDLAKATGVVAPSPEFYFVPDDPALGLYQKMFSNTVCLLELREPTVDGTSAKSTAKLLEKLVDDNDHRVQQPKVLKARLLDMLVGDWDRHFDQWKWGEIDTGKGKLYYPIPRDRDQAFFRSNGLLLGYVSYQRLPFLRGFRSNMPMINWFNFSARDFDRVFLNQLDAADWKTTITEFQKELPDSIIDKAVSRMPPEILAMDKGNIARRLKNRRDIIMKRGMKYYKFISDYVNVIGTNEREYFHVSSVDTGLRVIVYGRSGGIDTSFKIYERTFKLKETDEIRLYGLNGNDLFYVDENAASKIKMRIIGGKGSDTFNIKGKIRNVLYDMKDSVNYVVNTSRSKIRFSKALDINNFNWVEYKYNEYRYPRITAAVNPDDGLLLGAGFWKRSYGFRKQPYSSDQRFSVLYALNRGAYRLHYSGDYVQLLGNYDVMLRADLVSPTLNNFFGLGNNTEINNDKNIRFYRARYKYFEADAMLKTRMGGALSVALGPTFYRYWYEPENNNGKILERPEDIGLSSASVYTNKSYLGVKGAIHINNLNSELFPTRGIQWNTELSALAGVSGNSGSLTKLTSDMAVYASLSSPAKLVAVLRLGGGHIFNKNFEYFQALNLGANNFLRGFRKNRFSGSSLAYGSMELRYKLFQSKWYVLPGDVGLVAFNDVGRVWLRSEKSKRWHNAYGGGLYYVPFNMVIVSATMAFSKEENLFNFSVGTKINITF
jgi:hypothetical protein